MKLTRLAVFHPVIAVTVTAALVIFGIASFLTLGLEQNPQVDVPIVTITAPYPGASAESVEESVTRAIEDAVAGIGGIKTITSNSQTSVSVITVEFSRTAPTSTWPPATSSSASAASGAPCHRTSRIRA